MRGPAEKLLVAALLIAVALAGCVSPGEPPAGAMVDATGARVDVSDLSRIVATSHDLVEILFELGHGARVVGVPAWIDHPAGPWPHGIGTVNGTPAHIGRPHILDLEGIVATDPSLVLLKDHPLQPTGLADGLQSVGIPVFVFANDETLENIEYTYRTVATILAPVDPDAPAAADARWDAIAAGFAAIEAAVASSTAPRPVTLYQLPVGFVAGSGTSADLLLRLAGARNLADEAGIQGYQQIAEEVITQADPERIVAEHTAAASPDVFYRNPRYESTSAARLGPETLLIVDPATTALVGPRFVEGVREVAEWLHPQAFGLIEVQIDWRPGAVRGVTATVLSGEGPFLFRFDPGDGSPPYENASGDFTHEYKSREGYEARLLVIDGKGRMHESRQVLEE